jgi:signal transduction histidine kinase
LELLQTLDTFRPLVTDGHDDTQLILFIKGIGEEKNSVVGLVSLQAMGIPDLLGSWHAAAGNSAYLVASDGRILYQSDPSQIGTVTSIPLNISKPEYRHNHAGRDVIATSVPIASTGWILVQEEELEETISPLLRYTQVTPLVLVPGLLLTFVAVWFGIQRIVYPLQCLEDQATSLDWGDFSAIDQPVGGIEEIQRLQATLRHLVQRIQKAQVGMHNYIGEITRAQEDERLRLARELHDQTAQSLVALNHRMQMIAPHLKNDPEAAALITETRSMIMQTLDDLRRVVRALRPVYLEELGLVPALQMLARDIAPHKQMSVDFEKIGSPQRLSAENEIALYRIAQEALNNAWRHSEATHIWLAVQFDDQHVMVSVRDNGRGFTAPRHAVELTEGNQGHFGIMGMYERASLIGTHLHIQSELGKGTSITVRCPLH